MGRSVQSLQGGKAAESRLVAQIPARGQRPGPELLVEESASLVAHVSNL